MDEDRLFELIEAYGADDGAWPGAERIAALQTLALSPRAQALLGEAKALDSLIAPPSDPGAIGALKARILMNAAKESSGWGARTAHALGFAAARGNWSVWRPVGVLMASAVLGIAVGSSLVPHPRIVQVVTTEQPAQQVIVLAADNNGATNEDFE